MFFVYQNLSCIKITADHFSQSEHYYVMTLIILKPVLIVFCSLGIK